MNYDKIGIGYNQTRRADPHLANKLHQLLEPQADKSYVDIGCGTGNYTLKLIEKGVDVIGIDPSIEMLDKAKNRHPKGKWLQGKAEEIPLADQSVDGVLASLTLHHWSDIVAGFKEIHRISRAGKFVIFTSFPNQMEQYWLNAYFPEMMRQSIQNMPSEAFLQACATEAGWEIVQREAYPVQEDLQDYFLYIGKHNPERYFDEKIRNGISSFRLDGFRRGGS